MITKLGTAAKESLSNSDRAYIVANVVKDSIIDDVPFVGAGLLAQKLPVKSLQNKVDAYANRVINEQVPALQVSKDFIENKMLPRYGLKSTDVPVSSLVGANGKADAAIVGKELQHAFNRKYTTGDKGYKALAFLRRHPYLLTPLGAKATYDANRDNASSGNPLASTRGAVFGNIAAMSPHLATTADDIVSSMKSIRTLKELGYDKETIKAAKRKLRAATLKNLAPAVAFHGLMNVGAIGAAKLMNLRDTFKQLSDIHAEHFASEKNKKGAKNIGNAVPNGVPTA